MRLLCSLAVITLMMGRVEVAAQTDQTPKPRAEQKASPKFKDIGVEEFDRLRQSKTNVVLDVRTREEYEEGHLPGAILIDFMAPDFEKEIAKLDKGKTYLVHCASGGRSARACKKMEGLKFKSLFNLEGGIGAWEEAGKPVVKGKR